MSWGRLLGGLVVAFLAVEPFLPLGRMREYLVHVLVQIFIWSFIGGAWSLMGRFGLISLGHGAFLGVGAYATCLLWNFFGMTPWIGGILAVLLDRYGVRGWHVEHATIHGFQPQLDR